MKRKDIPLSIYYNDTINRVLEEKQSGYRITKENIFIFLTDEISLEAINKVEESSFYYAKRHISFGVKELGNKEQINYNAVIREAVTATESYLIELAELAPTGKITMGDAVKSIRRRYDDKIQMEFIKPFEMLYGIASNIGIRHAGNDKTIVTDLEEAILILTTCSALLNYLSSKLSKI